MKADGSDNCQGKTISSQVKSDIEKSFYIKPVVKRYGSVVDLTAGARGSGIDSANKHTPT